MRHRKGRLGQIALCDGGSRSRSHNGGSLGAGLNGSGSSSSSSRGRSSGGVDGRLSGSSLSVGRAVARDVAGLGALVADLAGGAERTTVGGGAVAGDVAKLATGIALHGLGLAVTGEVVRTTALVAGGSARVATKASAEALVPTTRTGATTCAGGRGVGAVALLFDQSWPSTTVTESTYSKVAGLAAVVAAAIGTVQAQGGAVSLDVAEALAVVALLGLKTISIRAQK